jgi:D-amino peptidase
MTQGVGDGPDGAFDGAAFIGYHAGAGNANGVIAHTYSSSTVMEARVHGVPHNEAGLNAIRLGHFGIPVILVAGDDALAVEVQALLPWSERVIVKRALGYGVTDSLSPEAARSAIRAGMAAALARHSEMQPYRPLPLAGEVDLRLPSMAAHVAIIPGVERIGPRTVAFGGQDGDAFFRTFVAIQRLAILTTL